MSQYKAPTAAPNQFGNTLPHRSHRTKRTGFRKAGSVPNPSPWYSNAWRHLLSLCSSPDQDWSRLEVHRREIERLRALSGMMRRHKAITWCCDRARAAGIKLHLRASAPTQHPHPTRKKIRLRAL